MPVTAKASAQATAKPKRVVRNAPSEPPKGKVAARKSATAAEPAKKAAQAGAKTAKVKEPLVRDSFTMPAADFGLIGGMKARAIKLMRPAKKSELLRAGLHALAGLNDTQFRSALDALTPLKPGRPKKAG